jgi:hypothetical protein
VVLCAVAALFAPVSAKPVKSPEPPVARAPQSAPSAIPAETDASAELFVTLKPGDSLRDLLVGAGVASEDAKAVHGLVAAALAARPAQAAEVSLLLGSAGKQRLQRVTVRSGLELKLSVVRAPAGGLRLVRDEIAVDSTPLRFAGPVGGSLYWSLRASGVPAEAASEYLAVVSGHVDIARELRSGDCFDLILAHRRASTGETRTGPLLYAAVDRASGSDVQLVNWKAAGGSGWFDAKGSPSADAGLAWPVRGRVSSHFGTRVHPILLFARFHRGVDLSAPRGTPIVAAADGRVVGAGWNGGHGRQVRIAHPAGLETSYSHMSEIAAEPGAFVRRGQLIGYVGSTGFSTGPHLHYEVRRAGQPIDPLSARHAGAEALSPADRASIRARLRQLLAVPA